VSASAAFIKANETGDINWWSICAGRFLSSRRCRCKDAGEAAGSAAKCAERDDANDDSSARKKRFFVMILGALSLHPKMPFPAAGHGDGSTAGSKGAENGQLKQIPVPITYRWASVAWRWPQRSAKLRQAIYGHLRKPQHVAAPPCRSF
jgi:hypothetical protein